ncbi:hypothetical protein [Acinetobacter sp. P1(2025)]|uniref:hypothetical protein n=1 Tax=Acinetobacter sp. P1(2025) TaxID=3446120 RepID=UPI003F52BC4D
MPSLSNEFLNPLKVVNARCEHLRLNFKGIMKRIELRAIHHINCGRNIGSIVTWDDWIYSALDCYFPSWKNGLVENSPIPEKYINGMPMPTGELVTVGSWLLSKNIYRFDDDVASELIKSEFEGTLPNSLIHIPDLCVYVQTDNFDLNFQGNKVYGVIFTVTELCFKKVLVSTVFLDTGLTKTAVLMIDQEKTIDESLLDFINEFHSDSVVFNEEEVKQYQSLQKNLINILLWFSLSKPDYVPLLPDQHKEVSGVQSVKGTLRLFEAKKYKPFIAGRETAKQIQAVKDELGKSNQKIAKQQRKPHLRRAHYHLYWYGAKGSFERYEFKWIPITLVGGSVELV